MVRRRLNRTRNRARRGAAHRLPRTLEPLFWEYRFSDLTWDDDHELISERILAAGDWQAVQWLLGRVGVAGIREWLMQNRGRGLSAQRVRFWQVVIDLPRRDVNHWLEQQAREPWGRRVAP